MTDTCPKCGKHLIDTCPICHQTVDTYSRIVGYLRPISTWNDGKVCEYHDRTNYTLWGKQPIDEQAKTTD